MGILNLQRRLRQAGRIRIGEQVAMSNGKTRPAKLDRFRLTSPDKDVLAEAAAIYGGTVRRWEGAPIGEQYELKTDTAVLDVIVPPTEMAFSQWYETWSGGGCTRRCDGVTELISGRDCICDAEDEKTCKPMSRLSLILKDLPGLGVWRLDSGGWSAASELAGIIDVIQAAASNGQLLPAKLRLEQRQAKRLVDGKPQTLNYAVPTLDVALRPAQLGMNVAHELGNGEPARPAAIAYIPAELPEAWRLEAMPDPAEPDDRPSLADAINQPAKPPRKTRASAPPIPSTGLTPRTAGHRPVVDIEDPFPDEPAPLPLDRDAALATDPQLRHIQTLYSKIGVPDTDRKRCSAGIVGEDHLPTHHQLTVAQASTVIDRLNDVQQGRMDLVLDAEQHPIGIKPR